MSPSAKSRVSATGLAKAANLRRLPQIGPAGVVRLSEAVRPWDRRVANSLVRLTAPTILYFTGGTASATSDQLNESQGAESAGDDLTDPVNRMEFLNRWSEAYGRGVAPGTTQTVHTDLTFLRLDSRINFAPEWELGLRA